MAWLRRYTRPFFKTHFLLVGFAAGYSFIYKIARCDLSQSNSESNNYTHPSPFVQRTPRSLNSLLGWEGDLEEAMAYAYPCPKKRAEERQRFQQKAISRVFASDLNGEYWRHCITLNLGNGMSVSEKEAKRRLNYLRVRLLKAMFGNSWRRMGVSIRYLLFKQGTEDRGNQHFHVLMAIEGERDCVCALGTWATVALPIALAGLDHDPCFLTIFRASVVSNTPLFSMRLGTNTSA
jgi:hypothetical protein